MLVLIDGGNEFSIFSPEWTVIRAALPTRWWLSSQMAGGWESSCGGSKVVVRIFHRYLARLRK
jgi:hypothetical protein